MDRNFFGFARNPSGIRAVRGCPCSAIVQRRVHQSWPSVPGRVHLIDSHVQFYPFVWRELLRQFGRLSTTGRPILCRVQVSEHRVLFNSPTVLFMSL